MFGDHFYHERTRKSVAVFGSLFNNLYVVRKSGNKVLGQMKVPIAYAPKRKFLERISDMYNAGDRDIENQTAIKLPRMSFEIVSMQYDPARQLPKTNSIKCFSCEDEGGANQVYGGVPYILTFELNIYGKQHDDCLQCVEQILPYFNPQYTVSMKPLEGMSELVEDVPVILQSTSFTDNFEGTLEDRRTIIYTLTFDMKVNMWGPVSKTPRKVITRIDIDFFNDWPTAFDPVKDPEYLETERIETVPRPVSEDSDWGVSVDVINLDHPYPGDPSYPSYKIPTLYLDLGETKTFDLNDYNYFNVPPSEYTLIDGDILDTTPVGDVTLKINGEIVATAINSPAVDVMLYDVLNPRGKIINTTVNIVVLPDSDTDIIMLETDDPNQKDFILTEPSDMKTITDLYSLEDSA